jgi:hypothetical protein
LFAQFSNWARIASYDLPVPISIGQFQFSADFVSFSATFLKRFQSNRRADLSLVLARSTGAAKVRKLWSVRRPRSRVFLFERSRFLAPHTA